ncbi:MAG TPA: branched-chain amino acid ABC transporter permease [Conexibacter sp.]
MSSLDARRLRAVGLLVALVLAVVVVPALPIFYVGTAGQIAAFAIVAMGASLIVQHVNLPSLGHGAFFGIAAYAVGLLMLHGIPQTIPALLLAILITGAFAGVMGLVVLRTRAAYFMMITLAIGQLLSGLASSLSFTGGDNGLSGIPFATIGSIDLSDPTQFYFTCLVVLIVVAVILKLLVDAPFGFALRSLAGDDRRARSLGVSPLRVKLIAFVVSGMLTGLGGALYTLNSGFADPSMLSATTSGSIFLMVALTTRLGVLGPIVGAILVEGITLIVGNHTTHSQLVLGIVAALIALFVMRSDGAGGGVGRRRAGDDSATPSAGQRQVAGEPAGAGERSASTVGKEPLDAV